MKRSTTILATIALGAMLATGSATVSMARGGGGGGGGHGGGGHGGGGHSESMGGGGHGGGFSGFSGRAASIGAGARGGDGHGFGRDHRRGDVYEDGYCGYPYPYEGYLGPFTFCP
jgi:hypothetical protein